MDRTKQREVNTYLMMSPEELTKFQVWQRRMSLEYADANRLSRQEIISIVRGANQPPLQRSDEKLHAQRDQAMLDQLAPEDRTLKQTLEKILYTNYRRRD